MGFIPDAWLDGPGGNTPVTAAKLANMEQQYPSATAYADANFEGGIGARLFVSPSGNDANSGKTMSKAKLTIAAARAAMAGQAGTIFLSAGTISAGSGEVWGSGDICGLVGAGISKTTIVATSQSGAVLDFRNPGYALDATEVGGFTVQGDGTANAANKGVVFGPTTSNSKLWVHDILVNSTGGPCFDLGDVELCHFDRLYAKEPVNAGTADVAYVVATGAFNGNTITGLQLYGVSVGANVGPSGAVIIKDNGTTAPHDNHWATPKCENLHLPSGGTIFAFAGNSQVISNLEMFDSSKVSGATGTSHIRFTAPSVTNIGGNLVTGAIPGKSTGATDIDMGIDMQQSRNAVIGVKGYKGTNVIISSGVTNTDVSLGGSVSGATDPAVIDNSGSTSNTIRDASVLLFPNGYRRMFSGRYYGPANHTLGSLNAANGTQYAVPVWVPHAITISELDIDLVTVAASSFVRLGVYANDPARDAPGALLLDAGTLDTSVTTGIRAITGLSLSIGAGLYWLAAAAQGGTPTIRGITGSLEPVAPGALLSSSAEINCFYQNSVSGAFATWGAGALNSTINGPKIMLKVT